ncbi:hypothetical protein LCGC14_1545390 [marine sediment metagenome]|uniref:Uncharacterized protein n=1 Tax=marine sediment metagenome TaxID=412755 RepID=A0A0F9IRP7_9ZZZZ
MFRFDENAVEKKFRDRLDEYMLGVMLMRPKYSKKTVGPQMGMKVIMLDKLVAQKNKEVIDIVVRQVTEAMAQGIAKLYGSTSCVFVPSPLEFAYERVMFEIIEGEEKVPGTEVTIITNIVAE